MCICRGESLFTLAMNYSQFWWEKWSRLLAAVKPSAHPRHIFISTKSQHPTLLKWQSSTYNDIQCVLSLEEAFPHQIKIYQTISHRSPMKTWKVWQSSKSNHVYSDTSLTSSISVRMSALVRWHLSSTHLKFPPCFLKQRTRPFLLCQSKDSANSSYLEMPPSAGRP